MVKCLLCGVELKNEAGLSGHMRMVHPTAISVDGHEVEARLEAVEKRLGLTVEALTAMRQHLSALHETQDAIVKLLAKAKITRG